MSRGGAGGSRGSEGGEGGSGGGEGGSGRSAQSFRTSRVGLPPVGPGRAVQFDPIKPTLKPPGTKRSKLFCIMLLSIFASNFNVRRYTPARGEAPRAADRPGGGLPFSCASPPPR